ncbi:MAG: hypothetical protein KF905_13730 [Flavobacteriales bacterium]|nr:hypothetical protein [Flavobacteriales bacterium]
MKDKKTIFLYGFFLLSGIHWGGLVLTALFSNIIGPFVKIDELPWFRMVVVFAQVFVAYKLLNKKVEDSFVQTKSLMKLMTLAVILFGLAQLDDYYDYSYGFCGTALVDGSLDDLFIARNRNLTYVQVMETLTLSMAMVSYTVVHVKRNLPYPQ